MGRHASLRFHIYVRIGEQCFFESNKKIENPTENVGKINEGEVGEHLKSSLKEMKKIKKL